MVKSVKVVTWNVCGLRAMIRKNRFEAVFTEEQPDVLCLNETMLQNSHIDALKPLLPSGYHAYFACSVARKGYSGVAILSKQPPLKVSEGLGSADHDREGRVLVAEFPAFYLVSTYVPNAGVKLCRLAYRTKAWDPALREFLRKLQIEKPVICCGDFNVVHQDIDIYDITGKEGCGCCTPQERAGFRRTLRQLSLIDSFRTLHPRKRKWSYYSRRQKHMRPQGKGWRLDYILASAQLQKSLKAAYIREDILGSDHHPCVAVFDLPEFNS